MSFISTFYTELYFFKDFIYLLSERGREEKHQLVVSHTPPTGNLAHNPGMCPDPELNQKPCGPRADAQPTEPHQPGLHWAFK